MAVSHISRRVMLLIVFGVALPAMLLAGLGIFLTLRIAFAVEDENVRYNSYMAQQLAEAFEQELMAHLRTQIAPAENAAREGEGTAAIRAALQDAVGEFRSADTVPRDDLSHYSLLVVESQPVFYAAGPDSLTFAGMMLRDGEGRIIGAGGWWFSPEWFLVSHLQTVVRNRLPANPRLYGGFESTRRLSFALLSPDGAELAQVRASGNPRTAREEEIGGPFEGFRVRVAATSNAPVVWTSRFVALEITFIGIMGLAIIAATVLGMRVVVRQLELAQIKAGFVSNVTHELKTPIALIRLAYETMELGRADSPEDRDRFLRTIGRETLRLSQLVDNILDFARLEAGQRVLRFESVDVAKLMRDTVDSFRPRLVAEGFALEFEEPSDLPLVRADATALSHCLLNLLDNALKYSRQRKEIRVWAETRGDAVAVAVRDHGMGIPHEHQKRIFEKFVRVETGLVHDVKGAGLGLSLVDQIMRAHGGRVELTSAPDEGSTFTLIVPVATGTRSERPEPLERTGS